MPAGKTESNFTHFTLPEGAFASASAEKARWERGQSGSRASWQSWPRACVAAATLLASVGCSQKSAEKCDEAQSTVRKALQSADFAAAKEWRIYAYKQCSDAGALGALDREIVDKETEVAEEKQREEAETARAQQYLTLFKKFASDHREAPNEISKAPDCGEGRTKERWCKVTRKVGDAGTFEARFWEADPKLVRFTTQLPKAVGCEDLGGSATVIKSWDVPAGGGSAKRFHCEMTGGALQGLHAVVTSAKGAQAHVFSSEYLAADPALRKYAQAE